MKRFFSKIQTKPQAKRYRVNAVKNKTERVIMTYYKLLNSHLRIKLNNYYCLDNDGRLVDHFRYHNIIIFIMYNREVPTIPSQ